MAAKVEINNNYTATKATTPFQRSLSMLRRSISLNDYQEGHLDILKLKDSGVEDGFSKANYAKLQIGRQISMQDSSIGFPGGRNRIRRDVSMASGSVTPPSSHFNELPSEVDVGPLATALFDNYFDTYVRYIILPVVVIFFTIYAFFHVPVQPKAEIYRSLSATFVLLVGIVVQCSLLTIWATRRYGIAELILFLRYCVTSSATSTSSDLES